MSRNADLKRSVIDRIVASDVWHETGVANFRTDGHNFHIRYCSPKDAAGSRYSFGINPNTLTADYEVWVCGLYEQYYLLPITVIQFIYEDPDAYTDKRHPEIRVVSVDLQNHSATYAAGGRSLNIEEYFQATL
ncbi:MAG: hypothetical protein LC803_07850 [Acidobacteria bacterium]|nr:hypothetical protein [Acidobacteriota bacterium]